MTPIAVLTPDPADASHTGEWPGVFARLAAALAPAGVEAVAEPWTAHVDSAAGLERFPLVLPLIVWGYHRDHRRWLKACGTWAAAGLPILNPAPVLARNSDKAYLRRLEAAGVAIPPTAWVDDPGPADVEAAFAAFGTDRLVIKPRVSGAAWKTRRLSRGEALTDAPTGPAMIQPYLPAIESEGETSLLFFDGRFSHAVNKRPAAGEFRVQVQFGGRNAAVTPDPAAMALAKRTLAAVPEPLLYARIDLARDEAGGWRLMEAELIEPDFYLGSAPDGGAAFAAAVKARL